MRSILRLPLYGLTALALALSGCSESAVEPSPDVGPSLQARGGASGMTLTEAGGYVLSVSPSQLDAVSAAIGDAGGTVVRSHAGAGIIVATGLSPDAATALSGGSGVRAMAADVMVPHPSRIRGVESTPASHDPKDAFFYQIGYQWDMEVIHADDAWDAGATAEGVTVAILDTGIDATHQDLAGLVDPSRSIAFVENVNPLIPAWGDDHYHGTHVAGTVASNGIGTAGVAPHATLMAVKICGAYFGCPFSAIVSGLLFSADNGADVVNMSLQGFVGKRFEGGGQLNALLTTVMNYASQKGVVVVSAAGNSGYDLDHLGRDFRAGSYVSTPCESGNGMCVSATNYWDEVTSYSNHGTSAISVAAPGGDTGVPYLVLAPCSTQSVYLPDVAGFSCEPTTYLWLSGTSMASPHVAGTAALVAARVGENPGRIRSILQNTADDLGKPGADPFYGKGRINVMNAWGN
ncbi:MAG: S8 family serine peptidase [Gemmatimonadota bacterium]|jgi:subtilisin family serine protease